MPDVEIHANKRMLEIHLATPARNNVLRSIPGQRFFDAQKGCWQVTPSPIAIRFLTEHIPDAYWANSARELAKSIMQVQHEREETLIAKHLEDYNINYEFKTVPYEHQKRALYVSANLPAFGLFMEMGTGKSKVAIDNAAWLFIRGQITGVLVVCPNSVKRNWADEELEKHLPDPLPWRVAVWRGGYYKDELEEINWLFQLEPGQSLPWLITNYEALITERGSAIVQRFLRTFDCMMICDESQMIKTPTAKRTKMAVKFGRLAKYRRILTGSPITNNPMDLYSQFAFLNQAILGHPSFFTFRQRYAVMGGYEGRQIVAYKHLDELEDLVRGHSFRVRKADCLDLPKRVYETLYVPLSDEQRRIYRQIKEQMLVELQGHQITASIVLTKLLRFQQIIGGAVPDINGNYVWLKPNPRLDTLLETIEGIEDKVVIWARFQHEVELITAELQRLYGEQAAVKFYGEIKPDARAAANARFQTQKNCRFFVATPATGGIGINLSAASTEIFYSNDFDMGHRNQAEERLDRADELTKERYLAGKSTLVIDLVAEKTVDVKIVRALKTKKAIADIVLSERFLEEED